jgi:tagatose 6-phosphate kinase
MMFSKLVPDSVNRAARTLDGSAGKSVNVAKVLKALGEQPIATGFLGGRRGEEIHADLVARAIQMEFLTVSAGTRQCISVINESDHTITELVEESHAVPESEYHRLIEIVRRRLADCRIVVMSGSLTPGGSVEFYQRCTQFAREAGVLSVIDAQGPPLMHALKAGPGLVKPNRAELAATVAGELKTESALISAMQELRRRGAERVVVTAGKEPTLAFDGQTAWKVCPPAIIPVNPIGSGDSFTAALAWRLAQGENLGEACRWGAAAGAANALTPMPGDLNRRDVERLVSEVKIERL